MTISAHNAPQPENASPDPRSLRLNPEERIDLIESNIRDYAIFTIDVDRRVASWNVGAEMLFGYTEAEIIGQNANIIFTEEDLAKGTDDAEFDRASETGRASDQRWHVRNDGSRFWADGILTALRQTTGELRGYAKIVRDFTERKHSADQLNAARAGAQEILDSITDAFFAIDDQHRFTFVNRHLQEWWGKAREEVIGKTIEEVFPRIIQTESYAHLIEALNTRQPRHYETDSPIVNRWIEVHIYPTSTGLSVFSQDIAARKIAEEQLRFQADMIDLAHDAILVTDMENRVIFWNRGAELKYGWTRDEAIGRVAFQLLDTVFPIPFQEVLDTLQTRGYWEAELTHTRKDGTRLIVASRWAVRRDEHGEIVSIMEVNRDVTRQKQLEQERAETAAKQARIAESLQRSLLLMPKSTKYEGLIIESFYEAASSEALVGGDFADVFAIDKHRVALVVGDVTGKGLVAATYTAEIKFALRAMVREYPQPEIAIRRLNHYLITAQEVEGLSSYSYVAMVLAIVDSLAGTVSLCCAGAEPAVIARQTGQVELVDAPGMILGVMHDAVYEASSAALNPGDLLAMTTDGITEARNKSGEFLGIEGFGAILKEVAREPARPTERTAQLSIEAARTFADGSLSDDVCLLLAWKV